MKKLNYIIAGISGHLAKTKLISAPEILERDCLDLKAKTWGLSRKEINIDGVETFTYGQLDMLYERIIETSIGFDNLNVLHLSIPPENNQTILEQIFASKLKLLPNLKIVLEKPFAGNYIQFQEFTKWLKINPEIESKLLFTDHYMFKDDLLNFANQNIITNEINNNPTNQNILEINIHETIGIEGRGDFFDQYGIVYDMFHSHGLQLFAVAYSKLWDMSREKALESLLKAVNSGNFVISLSQYDGYLSELGVAPNSDTPTYMNLDVYVMNEKTGEMDLITFDIGKKLIDKLIQVIYNNIDLVKITQSENAYSKMLRAICHNEFGTFLNIEEIDLQWQISEHIEEIAKLEK